MPGTHIDGTPAGNTFAALGLTAGMYTQTSTAGYGSGTCSNGAVSGTGCHGSVAFGAGDNGSWARRWNDAIV